MPIRIGPNILDLALPSFKVTRSYAINMRASTPEPRTPPKMIAPKPTKT